ncbi:ase inhibitor I4 serpin [Micractinium conductrix]|uniref:Ase inhibitor I4 serpin n=1 Tax=Micractinium conductrix TaxID=554055 RepID=A0A2P6VN81_9CHLO|nr:ase inhibitor I4 serpin [Micractinium conductrix]|eukprot:PSC75539.1 ase inhibitor I4 serpin [Micractinium conductrix]
MGAAASHAGGGAPSAALAASVNAFGSELFDRLAAEAKPGEHAGLFLSPYGIAQALGMLLNGVEPGGESFCQLQAAVYARGSAAADSQPLEQLNSALRWLSISLVKPPSDDLTVSDANSVWVNAKYALQPGFAEALRGAFDALAAPLTGAAAVNQWVAQETRDKIQSIVTEDVAAQATLILVNAVYFKGLWEHPFKKQSTHPMDFYPLQHGEPALSVAAMFQTYQGRSAVQIAKLPAKVGDASFDCAAVQLPYKGGEYYAVAAMPHGQLSGEAAEGGQRGLATSGGVVPLTQALAACRQALLVRLPGAGEGSAAWHVPNADVKVLLPRFEVEFGATLNDALQALGITRPFSPGDVTKMATTKGGTPVDDLYVSAVIHKVFAKVDEAGTEAAAATAVVMMRAAMPLPREEIELRFDRPFVFAVVHRESGLALFSGEVHRPEAWKQE